MNKRLDVGKVDAALKRAGHNAVTGARSAQSGRFISKQDATRHPKSVAASVLTQNSAKRKK